MTAWGRASRLVMGGPAVWAARRQTPQRVLVLGAYMRAKPNLAPRIAADLSLSRHHVIQSWAAVGEGVHGAVEMGSWTNIEAPQPVPKFELVNRLLKLHNLRDFTHVVVTDDDIELPNRFLDTFIGLQDRYRFALAQPARTQQSNIDHPVTLESHARIARETRFVEIGPLFSVAASAFPVILPFDERFFMGWGLDHVWPVQLGRAGLKLGIVDVTAVHHRFRPVASTYSGDQARRNMDILLAQQDIITPQDKAVPVRAHWW